MAWMRWADRRKAVESSRTASSASVRIRFEHETPAAPGVLADVRPRPLRPGFLVALGVAVGAAVVSLLTGFPLATGARAPTPPASAATTRPPHSSERAIPSAKPTTMDRGTNDLRFLESDDAGRMAYAAGDYEQALARFREALGRNPSDAESMSNAAQILVRLGRTGEAVPLLQRAIALNPSRWAYRFNLARALEQLSRLDQAIEQYEVAAALFPDDYATLFNLARTYHLQGREVAAVERYERAISLAPEEPTFHFALAMSLEKLGKNAEAATAYSRFLELAPESADAVRVRARIAQIESGANASGNPSPPQATPSTNPTVIR